MMGGRIMVCLFRSVSGVPCSVVVVFLVAVKSECVATSKLVAHIMVQRCHIVGTSYMLLSM